jgi:hypothetical protein
MRKSKQAALGPIATPSKGGKVGAFNPHKTLTPYRCKQGKKLEKKTNGTGIGKSTTGTGSCRIWTTPTAQNQAQPVQRARKALQLPTAEEEK